MKRCLAAVLGVATVLALAGCPERRNDYKGRPVPKDSVTCYDGTKQKNVGPWACDKHGGQMPKPKAKKTVNFQGGKR